MNEAYCVKCGFIGTKYDMNHRCFCGEIVWFEKMKDKHAGVDRFEPKNEEPEIPAKKPLAEILAGMAKK